MNRWSIAPHLEQKIRKRDKRCVYCSVALKAYPRAKGVPRNKATVEHIDNDDLDSPANVVMCCGGCNSSKGAKSLSLWFLSEYCHRKKISEKTVAAVVKNWLKQQKSRQRHLSAEINSCGTSRRPAP